MTSSAIVTGASAGLGLLASKELAAAGRHVVLACRDVAKGEAAGDKIMNEIPEATLEILELDLASLASVRAAAAAFIESAGDRPPLQALICNAGVQVVNGVRRSADGYELTFATNHLGHYLLTNLLLDHVIAPGRIVVVSSETHQGPPKSMGFPAPRWKNPHVLADPDAILDDSPKSGRIRYSTSKLANLYMTYELDRQLADRDITVNAFDPGLMPETGLDRDWPVLIQRIYAGFAPLLVRLPGVARVTDSARDLCWLVTSPEISDVSGAYFSGRRQRKSSKESYRRDYADELRKASDALVATA